MFGEVERRKEPRLHCDWVIWFAEDFNMKPYHGMIHDINTTGVAFVCYVGKNFIFEDQPIVTCFDIPSLSPGNPHRKIARTGVIRRVDELDNLLSKIHVEFYEPLPFEPVELEEINLVINTQQETIS